jgi:UDP-glucose 4-epimerase
MKIGVIGATGFIGQSVLRHLARQGRPAVAFARRPLPLAMAGEVAAYHNLADPACDRHLAELDCALFCTGSMLPSDHVTADQLHSAAQEALLLERCTRLARDCLLYVSSGGAVYGNTSGGSVAESAVCAPISVYGKYKLALEQQVAELCDRHGRRFVIARLSNPYGPLQSATKGQGLIARLLHCRRTGEEFTLWGDGGAVRDYLHIDDFCRFAELAATRNVGGVFNVGSGEGRSVRDILDLFVELASGTGFPIHQTGPRQCDVSRIVLDTTKAARTFGWLPTRTLRDGLTELLAINPDARPL